MKSNLAVILVHIERALARNVVVYSSRLLKALYMDEIKTPSLPNIPTGRGKQLEYMTFYSGGSRKTTHLLYSEHN